MRILVDLDSVAADFFEGIWPSYHSITGHTHIGTADVKHWDMTTYLPDGHIIDQIFKAPGFFENLEPMPGAVNALKFLQSLGHEVVIVTAHCTPHSAAEKVKWVAKHLPFIKRKGLIITKHKGAISAQALVDDSVDNARDFKAEQKGVCLTIAYPYNDDPVFDGRYYGWQDPKLAWMQIVDRIMVIDEERKSIKAPEDFNGIMLRLYREALAKQPPTIMTNKEN